MRHANKVKKLGRTYAHRKATLAALSTALIEHKRITTTVSKAKALRSFVEPVINRAKEDTTHNRRQAFRRLRDKSAVKELFGGIADVLGDRPGGYTRIVKLGRRAGDSAEMAVIELVDFNDVKPHGETTGRKKTRRGRSRSATRKTATATPQQVPVEEPDSTVESVEEPAEEASAEVDYPAEAAEEAASEPVAVEEASIQEDEPADVLPTDEEPIENPTAPEVAPEANPHPDAEQGSPAGEGPPPPEADAETRGKSEHRG